MALKLLDVAMVAQRLQVSRQTVYNLIHAGKLRAYRFGQVYGIRIREEDFQAFLERRRVDEEDAL